MTQRYSSGKFIACVVDTGAVVHRDLQISPRIFSKIQNDPNKCYFQALGRKRFMKKMNQKTS
jgi:hypothetical protein